jgi:hypothetical protein
MAEAFLLTEPTIILSSHKACPEDAHPCPRTNDLVPRCWLDSVEGKELCSVSSLQLGPGGDASAPTMPLVVGLALSLGEAHWGSGPN